MNKKSVWTAGLLILLFGGILTWKLLHKKEPTFRITHVERGNLDLKILATGLVQPENRVEIKSPIAGRVEQPLVDEGQRVRKGQILAWMSSTERAALLDAARARGPEELAHWEDLYKPTPLVAPLPGAIIARNVEAGQTVTSADTVFVLSDRLIVKVDVDETDIGKIHKGMPVVYTLDAYSQSALGGRVVKIAEESKTVNNVTTYQVDVLPQSVPDFMKSGMTANIHFVVDSRKNVLLLSAEAIKSKGRGLSTVQLPDSKLKAAGETREIKTGLTDNKQTEVLEGLAEGDKVIVPVLTGGKDQKVNPLGMTGGGGRGGGRSAR